MSYNKPVFANISALVLALFLVGCVPRAPYYRSQVEQGIQQRTGHGLAPEATEAGPGIPEGVSLADGLTEEEAVGIALWNNPAFQADIAQLGLTRAELVQSGLLRNPVFTLLFPVGPKQLETYASWPLELLWQRPRRIAAAKLDLEQMAENLISHGLELVRDVRWAHADAVFAEQTLRQAEESAELRRRIADLVEARLRAGDVSELEAVAARTEQHVAQERAARSVYESAIAKERLRSLLGFETESSDFEITLVEGNLPAVPGVKELIERALASRPDLRAAELALEAARERAGLDRWGYLTASVIVDANSQGTESFEAGPGLQANLPVFDRNQGTIQKADAALEKASRDQFALKHRIEIEIIEAHARVQQARESLASWQQRILPSLSEVLDLTERAYHAGEVSYLFFLETTRQHLDARTSELDAQLALQRALASLQRSVGTKIDNPP